MGKNRATIAADTVYRAFTINKSSMTFIYAMSIFRNDGCRQSHINGNRKIQLL